MKGIDLGTYHVRVLFTNGRGFIDRWETGRRYTCGRSHSHPLLAHAIPPAWDDEDDLVGTIVYQFTEGNYSCDCNRLLFLADAEQADVPDDVPCGDTLELASLTLIRPNGEECPIDIEAERTVAKLRGKQRL